MKYLLWIVAAAALVMAVRSDRHRRHVDRVVIVTVDTARADHLPFLGYPRPTVLVMGQLAEEGFLFERAYTTSPDLPLALRSLATSRLPFNAAAPTEKTILERLRDRGFEVAAFSDDPVAMSAAGSVPVQTSSGVMQAALDASAWMKSRSRPKKVALWLHLNGAWEAAHPSRLDQLAPVGPELRRHLVNAQGIPLAGPDAEEALAALRLHDARILAVDRALQRFYGRTLNRKKPTMIVVTAGRGEALDGRGDDGLRLDEGLIRVPLIVWFSDDRGPGKRLPGLIRHIDVWPTIAALALPLHQRFGVGGEGRSFAGALRKTGGWAGTASAYVERASGTSALVAGQRKLIRFDDAWRLYDLSSDPLERADRSAAEPGTVSLMRRRLERFARG